MQAYKGQASELIKSMNEEELKNTIEIMQTIKSGKNIELFLSGKNIYSNVPNTLLKIRKCDDNLGPKKKYTLNETPFKIPINPIIDDYIIKNAEKFTGIPDGYVIKDNNDVVMRKGYKVIYKNYYFYIFCNGAVSLLFVSENALNVYVTEHDKYWNKRPEDNPSPIKHKYYAACTEKLQRLISIDKLEEELKIREERRGYYG